MLIVMNSQSGPSEIDAVSARAATVGLQAHLFRGQDRIAIAITGDVRPVSFETFRYMPGVAAVVPISKPYKLASREFHPDRTVIDIGPVRVGSEDLLVIAGPCSVESRAQLLETAWAVKEAGAHALRGGAFKPRTSPYSFQGLGHTGLEILAEARALTGLPIVTEVMEPDKVDLVSECADVLQIGSRNMQNYPLLTAVGKSRRPVLLKRGISATLDELLMAAEYVLAQGNRNVILCERGIRSYETSTRNTTDINALPVLSQRTHLPVLLDPSHATGQWDLVPPIARAAIAAGADGVIVEVHPAPDDALSDGGQSLKPEKFAGMVAELRAIAAAIGRRVPEVWDRESLPL